MAKRELGKVESVFFGREDHGILTIMVQLKFDGTSQGFGGYALDNYDKDLKRRIGAAAGTDLILRLLNLFSVDSLEKLKGRPVYALRVNDDWNQPIIGLEIPGFDGGGKLLIAEWQKHWYPKKNDK